MNTVECKTRRVPSYIRLKISIFFKNFYRESKLHILFHFRRSRMRVVHTICGIYITLFTVIVVIPFARAAHLGRYSLKSPPLKFEHSKVLTPRQNNRLIGDIHSLQFQLQNLSQSLNAWLAEFLNDAGQDIPGSEPSSSSLSVASVSSIESSNTGKYLNLPCRAFIRNENLTISFFSRDLFVFSLCDC